MGMLQMQLYTLYGQIHVDQIPYFVYSAILQHPLYGHYTSFAAEFPVSALGLPGLPAKVQQAGLRLRKLPATVYFP